MPLLSLAHFTVVEADPITLIEAAQAAGYDAIGLRIVPPFPTDHIVPVIGDPNMIRSIKRRLMETDIRVQRPSGWIATGGTRKLGRVRDRAVAAGVDREMTPIFGLRGTDEQIDVLRARLLATRWPSYDSRDDSSLGTSSDDAQRLARYW